ncbi:MAG: hypothetical protein ABJF10_05605 [Chthoniobacter sp.]|uniref:hypothetical protein n=1 Tax=Chthoniobacter sp. TaxID=2510640 RepID=UPI0032A31F2F
MKTTPQNNSSPSSFRRLALTGLVLLAGSVSGLASNPWTSSSMGWSEKGSSPSGWSSWDSTHGGTFGGASEAPRPHSRGKRSAGKNYGPVPTAIRDAAINPVMLKAGSIAEHRAEPHSTRLCWRYVKEALVASGSVDSYPQSTFAKQAGSELVNKYGFVKLPVRSAARAPIGSVIVYGGAGPGHVELRTSAGYVSDYRCAWPSGLPFIGAYARVEKPTLVASTNNPGL